MPLQTFDVSTRKVPSLALVPRGHLNHANRAKKKVAGSIQLASQTKSHPKQRDEDVLHANEDKILSPPHPARRQQLSDETVTEVTTQQDPPQDEHGIKQEEDDAELRLSERFLNMMALMARLSTQSLGNNSPHRLVRTNTEKSILLTSTERVLSPVAPLSPQQVKSPLKSPKHAVREVAKRLPRSLQGPLTFDICMLLPTPLDERQSPLKSPIRRKRLRKRLRRRRLRCRARRTWQASHASWPPHASADYIVDHTRQDIAGISATRLVERLGERKVNSQTLPRVISMPLPPLHRNKHVEIMKTIESVADEGLVESVDDSDNGEHGEEENSEAEIDEDEDEEEGEEDDSSSCDESPLPSDDTAAIASSSPQEMQEHDVERTVAQPKKQPLYHQPAWISPELHAWLVESRLFATKPRRELL